MVAFFIVELCRFFIYTTNDNWFEEFIHLRIPGTTTWYLKIQILMYVFLFFASFTGKHEPLFVSIFALFYAVISNILGMQDFWWKTALCFPAGTLTAANDSRIHSFFESGKRRAIVISAAILLMSVAWILLDRWLVLPLQLFSFMMFAVSLSALLDCLKYENYMFSRIGKWSLSIYLVHIGIVGIIIKTGTKEELLMFITLTVMMVTVTEIISGFIMRKIID